MSRMAEEYDLVAGRSLQRVAALSDGIFAIAMTILVLELRVPVVDARHSQKALWSVGAISHEQAVVDALGEVAPHLPVHIM